jgi:membrane protease YdiL (CAAX protease family)
MPEPDLKPPFESGVALPAEDGWAARLRAFGPVGILTMLVIPFAGTALIGAILVLLWARFSRTSWREIGYVRPKSWIHILAVGIAFGVAFKFLMKTMVMPLLGANPINQAYHYIAGNPAAALQMAVFVIVGAGFGEETVYRGFLFERFGKLFGTGLGAKGLTVLLTSIWFGQVHHADQGMAGAEQAAIMGLVFGAVFAITGRIFMLMFAHAAFDLTALAMIYWNVETKVAHLVFK